MHLLTLPYLANFLANPNVHVVASALKLYLREQAEPLFPYTTRQALIDAMQSPTLTDQDRSMALFSAIQNMPVENRLILQRCIMMMARFREYSDLNLMDAHNLAVVFGPNFMRAPVTSTNLQVILSEGALELEIVKALVSFPDHYFPQVYERTGENWEDSKSRAYPIPHLTEQDWFVILSRARVRTYQPGAVILELGQTNTSMFRIKKGKAKVAIGQERVVVATLIDLDIFGDMSVLGNSLVSATVLADTECECWVIDADFLGTLLALEPLLGLKFFGSLARELASRIEQRTGFAPPPAAGAAADEEPSGANKKQAEAAAAATAKQQKTLNGVVPLKSFQCTVQKPGVLHVFESSLVHVTKTLGYEKKNVTQLASVIELKCTQADKKRAPEFGMELRCKTPEFKLETITYLFGSADERDQAHQLVNDLMQRSIDLANATEVDQAQGEGASFKRMVVKQPYQARADGELTLCVGDIVSVPLDSSVVADPEVAALCEQCGVGQVAASVEVNNDLVRLCRKCVVATQEVATSTRKGSQIKPQRPGTQAPTPQQATLRKACQQCRKREAEARVTMPDGIQLKVCGKCVEGLRALEERATEQQHVQGDATPEQQIKELKIKKMMIAGQIGGIQRSLSTVSDATEIAVLRAEQDKLTAEMREIDGFVAALTKIEARGAATNAAPATPGGTPSPGSSIRKSGEKPPGTPPLNPRASPKPAPPPAQQRLPVSHSAVDVKRPPSLQSPQVLLAGVSDGDVRRFSVPAAVGEDDDDDAGNKVTCVVCNRKSRKVGKDGVCHRCVGDPRRRRGSRDVVPDDQEPSAVIDEELAFLAKPPLPPSPSVTPRSTGIGKSGLSQSGQRPPPPPTTTITPPPTTVASPPLPSPTAAQPPPPTFLPPPPSAMPPPPSAQPPPPAAMPPPPVAQPPPPSFQPPPPSAQPPPPQQQQQQEARNKHRHRKHRSTDKDQASDDEAEFVPPPPPGKPPGGPQGREGKPGEPGATKATGTTGATVGAGMALPLPRRDGSGSGKLLIEPLAEEAAAAAASMSADDHTMTDAISRRTERSLTISEPQWLDPAAAAAAAVAAVSGAADMKPRRSVPAAPSAEKMIEGTCHGRKGMFPARCLQSMQNEFGLGGLPTPADWDAILADGRSLNKRAGELVVRQGDDRDNDVIYVIMQGQCVLRRRESDGAESDVGQLQQPDVFGEMQFLLDSKAPFSVYAASDVVLTVLRAEALKELFEASPKLGCKFFKYLACVLDRRLRDLKK